MKVTFLLMASLLVLSGCYTDREFIRDMKQIDAQMRHAQTYRAIEAKGPIELKLDKESTVVLNVPSQPHRPIGFVSPMQEQSELAKTLGVLGLSAYGINRLSHGGDTKVINGNSKSGAVAAQ